MKSGRVKRSAGPKSHLTKAAYRKKALPFLLEDFERRCAYCLDPSDFRHPSQDQVDHFNCKLTGCKRHQYKNLMLACGACNLSKHDKPITNPLDSEQRLLNCTEEYEFPKNIIETEDGQWEAVTKAGEYHLISIGLTEGCHRAKRAARRKIAWQILNLCSKAIQYVGYNPVEIHKEITETIRLLLNHLENFPPLVTEHGVVSICDWLKLQGVDISPFQKPSGFDVKAPPASVV